MGWVGATRCGQRASETRP
uniref:Alpha(B)-crystallin protein n=1 Tax=Rattus norvegicus TaxID=10116 RepID=Q63136_RAT|nr:ORF1 [Rattus norvegicus]